MHTLVRSDDWLRTRSAHEGRRQRLFVTVAAAVCCDCGSYIQCWLYTHITRPRQYKCLQFHAQLIPEGLFTSVPIYTMRDWLTGRTGGLTGEINSTLWRREKYCFAAAAVAPYVYTEGACYTLNVAGTLGAWHTAPSNITTSNVAHTESAYRHRI